VNELTIASSTAAIEEARRWAVRQLHVEGLGDEEIWAVELALTEVLSNVIRHAYGGDESREVLLQLSLEPDRLELAVTHWGTPFDEQAYVPPKLESPQAGGYGVRMIEDLMDEVRRGEADSGGTRIVLVKSRRKEHQ
jgi:anti-sigma regulatory factor (Ser/Thr protein kinase)